MVKGIYLGDEDNISSVVGLVARAKTTTSILYAVVKILVSKISSSSQVFVLGEVSGEASTVLSITSSIRISCDRQSQLQNAFSPLQDVKNPKPGCLARNPNTAYKAKRNLKVRLDEWISNGRIQDLSFINL